jgi:hypothetical protein
VLQPKEAKNIIIEVTNDNLAILSETSNKKNE